ncbi:MAG TPA: alpha-E domain-containing protein [Chitinophagaceae bacterium]|nr:alpha-E domain-containing protein [Chitinophagaceae bacterium]
MLSRTADSMFWLSRYMERSDGLLRGIKTNYILLLDKGVNEHLSWRPMLEIFTSAGEKEIALLELNTDAALYKLISDKENFNALKILITRARENARGMQDHITKEVWEQVNQMYHLINQSKLDSQLKSFEAIKTIDLLTNECILYSGVTDTTMPRGMGWSFMSLGKHIERCLLTIEMADKYFSLIDYNIEEEKDILQWRPMLLSLSGYELHLKTYRSSEYNLNALHQVLFNEKFSRSVLYTLKRVEKYFEDVTKDHHSKEIEVLTKCLGRLVSKLQYTDFDSINQLTLQKFLSETRKELNEFGSLLAKSFFSYS